MNKFISKIFISFFVFFSFFLFSTNVKANNINDINMDIYIDKNGNATVTEVWDAYLNEGTEGYRKYTNLGKSKISNFSVSDESGTIYENLSKWKAKDNFNNKSYKSGINNIRGGLELCWGISKYGNKTYTLKYNISNLVNQYKDFQGIYFNFLNLDQSVAHVKITIHSDIEFSQENTKIWAFGNDGSINFQDGNIVLDSENALIKYEYMVGLIKFEENIFDTSTKINKTFDTIYNSAIKGIDDKSTISKIKDFIITLFKLIGLLVFNPVTLIIISVVYETRYKNKKTKAIINTLMPEENSTILTNDEEIEYYRDIPCNKDLQYAYWICSTYNISSQNLGKGMIGAILLKWVKNGNITIYNNSKRRKENYIIDFSKMSDTDNIAENLLFKILTYAADGGTTLETKKLKKWSYKNYDILSKWFSKIKGEEKTILKQQGLIINSTKKVMGINGTQIDYPTEIFSEKLKEEAIKLKGFKNFLLDFSSMPEKEYFDVHIWEEYLIFAELLGIADKVSKQLNTLYPNSFDKSIISIDIKTSVSDISDTCYEGMKKGLTKIETKRYNKEHGISGGSSGGGGSSFDGGGSSAGGSSGGGFR